MNNDSKAWELLEKSFLVIYCRFMFISSCSCNQPHADIKIIHGRTAAVVAREYGYPALADYVEAFQPGPRGELAISCCYSELHSQQGRN